MSKDNNTNNTNNNTDPEISGEVRDEESGASENIGAEAVSEQKSGSKKSGKKKSRSDDEKISKDEKSEDSKKRFRFDWELEENLIEALDEDALDLTEAGADETEPIEIEGKSAVTLAQAAQTVFGLFLIIFSIIGVVATVLKAVSLAKAQKDNSAQLEYFEDLFLPVAAIDAPTFDGASSLNEDVILSCACWDIIFNPSAFYEYSNGSYKVSYLDIDRRITKLFGAGLSYSHKTVGDTELTFDYDEDTGMYTIPAFPHAQAYYPDVTAITETENGADITVEYRQPITVWIDSEDEVDKTMIYSVVPNGTEYVITAIRIGEIDITEAN